MAEDGKSLNRMNIAICMVCVYAFRFVIINLNLEINKFQIKNITFLHASSLKLFHSCVSHIFQRQLEVWRDD